MRRLFRRRRPELAHANGTPPPEDVIEDGQGAQMSLFEHLGELRRRATWAFAAIVVGTVVGFLLSGAVLDFIRGPYCEITDAPADCQLVVLGPTEGIVQYFRVALMIGGILAIPILTYQSMMFVLPALKRGEKRVVFMSLPAITLLFLVGVGFAWYILVPPALSFLEGFQANLFQPEWTASLYINFVTSLVFWMGVAFETPLIFFVLALLGVVEAGALARNWRVAVVGSAIAAAFITPTIDPVNMALVMGPLMVLYAVSIVMVVLGRRISRR